MARLSAHGQELDRREYPSCRVAVMSDGNIMRNYGQGWKLWKRVKPGIDVRQYAQGLRARYDARPAEFHNYMKALSDACDLEHRARLHMAIDLMPTDPDGVWSTMDDYSYGVDLEDIVRACRARVALEAYYKTPEFAAWAAVRYPHLTAAQVQNSES